MYRLHIADIDIQCYIKVEKNIKISAIKLHVKVQYTQVWILLTEHVEKYNVVILSKLTGDALRKE